MKYIFTNESKKDLKSIWRYTNKTWGQKKSDQYIGGLKDCCANLSEMPNVGKNVDIIRPGLRVYVYKHHYIFFMKNNSNIIIVAIIHEKMDLLKYES